jgi:putative ABC transport system substrate-binding protein
MNRRNFIASSASIALAWPHATRAQQRKRVHRLAHLSGGSMASRAALWSAFMQGMGELGYIEGDNLVIEHRYAEGRFETLPRLAGELVAWGPDVIFVSTTPATLAAKAATSNVPIVMVGVADPLGSKIIESLARPGGNVTGVTNIAAELAGKRLEVLKEIIPTVSKVAVMINPNDPNASLQMTSARSAADALSVQLDPILPIRSAADLKGAFDAAAKARVSGALRMIDSVATALRPLTVAHAAEYRIPIIYGFREDVVAGGLVSYGPNFPNQYRQAATYVHKLFTGAMPADLPVERPSKFELVINLKTAKGLGLDISPMLLARADEVIE